MKYKIRVFEMFSWEANVEALTKELAIQKVKTMITRGEIPETKDLEHSHTLPSDQWDIGELPKPGQTWFFTFGSAHFPGDNYYTKIRGTFTEARAKMFEKFQDKWAFQYDFKQGIEMKKDSTKYMIRPIRYFSWYKFKNKKS